MRQILSTALVAVIVGALAGMTAGTMAQAPAETERITTPAGFNADKVDGKHAVRATKTLRLRAKKLVATDRTGFLPDNIVKPMWHLIKNKPAVLADGQVSWSEIAGRPAPPIVRLVTVTNMVALPPGDYSQLSAACPPGSKVTGGGYFDIDTGNELVDSWPSSPSSWTVTVDVNNAGDTVSAYAVCMSVENMSLAGRLTPAAKNPKRN